MSNSRPTNREILSQFENHVKSSQTTLLRMENKIHGLQEDLTEIRENQLTTGKVMALIAISISGTIGIILSIIQTMQ